MAATTASRTASTLLSAAARLSAAASPLRRFSSKNDAADYAIGGEYLRPNRSLTAYQVPDGVAVRVDAPGLRLRELRVWREDGAVVFHGAASAPGPGEPRRDLRGLVVVPPCDEYAMEDVTAVVMRGCLELVLKRKNAEVEDPSMELVHIKVE